MRRLALPAIILWLWGCSTGSMNRSDTQRCGPMPEVPYSCPAGVQPCQCMDHADGTSQWHCDGCPPVDCNTNPNEPICKTDAACIGCHGLASQPGGVGIENAHPWSTLGCTVCHGGVGADPNDPTRKLTQAEAHVHIPHDIADNGSITKPIRTVYKNFYLGRAGVEQLPGGPEWIRFMNPGDLRVVDATCAKSGCHEGAGEKVRRSTMSTLVGKFDAMLYAFGLPRHSQYAPAMGDGSADKRRASYGALAVTNPQYDRASAPPGAVAGLVALTTVDRETQRPYGTFTEQDLLQETINKLCGNCHLNNNGANSAYGNFRSSGCTACHMPYDYSGQSQSGDPLVPKDEPRYPAAYQEIQYPERPHPIRHQLQRVMAAKDCEACHTGSNRTVYQYMGIRTDDNRDLTRARAAGANIDFRYATLIDNRQDPNARLHGFTQDQLIEYEDLDGDGQDDTPPDVHYLAGMECIDCHTAGDMHGDGNIYSRQNQATQVRCVHCHGNLENIADPDAASNPINQLYRTQGTVSYQKPERKWLWKFDAVPGYGETGYPYVKVPGIWMHTKTRGEWKYVPQIRWAAQWDPNAQDCIGDGRRADPRGGGFVCSPRASIAHGRWQGLNAGAGDLLDGVGPRPGIEVVTGPDGTTTSVRFGFSHLGNAAATNQDPDQGLECASCHALWQNMRYGNHIGLVDTDGQQRFYDWDRVTGQTTLGKQGWFDFTFVDMLDLQLGVDTRGKIGELIPTRVKVFVRGSVLDPGTGRATEFMSETWKTYRDRVGYGNLVRGASGISDAPGWAPICLEPVGFCDQDPLKNLNGALGMDTQAPHSIQKRARDCTSCHLDAGGGGLAKVSAVFGWNPQGFTAQTSAYLRRIQSIQTNHGNYTTANGFVLADDGIEHKLDWLVDESSGYPLMCTVQGRTDGGRGYATYDPAAAGPITKPLIEALKRIRVHNAQ